MAHFYRSFRCPFFYGEPPTENSGYEWPHDDASIGSPFILDFRQIEFPVEKA
jgi:hypothetical protein